MPEHMVSSMPRTDDRSWFRADEAVQRLEDQWQHTPAPDLTQFVPAPSDPLRERVLLELIKVDQEYRWQAGEQRRIEEYLKEWPELSRETVLVAELLLPNA